MVENFEGQVVQTPEDLGITVFPKNINNVVGTTATKLTRPTGKKILVLMAVKGDWNARNGDFVSSGMPSVFAVTSASTTDTAPFPLHEKEKVTLQAPAEVTVKGYNATDVISYYWI